ncbi:MAG: GyrI-like domain-containing protein [Clostridia bacterium]|nr:GyrI-like domain-containing protein [Clostridia bacterium]
MQYFEQIKPAFSVIGKEGSTLDGPGFIQNLWADANGHFAEVAPLAKVNEDGSLVGVWGAMTDFSRSFQPWEDGFTKGLYLAGVECRDDAQAPEGWVKWSIPGYRYLVCENGDGAFPAMLQEMENLGLQLAGAVHDFTNPANGKGYMYFPVEKL